MLVEVGAGQHVASNTTMGELLDRWFELSSPDWSPATAQVTRWFSDLYIRPRMGPLLLRKITVAELDRFYRAARDEGGEERQASVSQHRAGRAQHRAARARAGLAMGLDRSQPSRRTCPRQSSSGASRSPPRRMNCASCFRRLKSTTRTSRRTSGSRLRPAPSSGNLWIALGGTRSRGCDRADLAEVRVVTKAWSIRTRRPTRHVVFALDASTIEILRATSGPV